MPTPPTPGWGIFVDLFGQNPMQGQFRVIPGSRWQPSLTFDGDSRTGIYQPKPFAIGYSIFAHLRFMVDHAGISVYNDNGVGGTISADNLTADRFYQLPDQSGTIALEEDVVSTMVEYKTIEVTDTATLILDENSTRLGYSISNDTGYDVYVGFSNSVTVGDVASATGGTRLNAFGGYAGSGGAKLRYVGAIYAIASPGQSAILAVAEFLP